MKVQLSSSDHFGQEAVAGELFAVLVGCVPVGVVFVGGGAREHFFVCTVEVVQQTQRCS